MGLKMHRNKIDLKKEETFVNYLLEAEQLGKHYVEALKSQQKLQRSQVEIEDTE